MKYIEMVSLSILTILYWILLAIGRKIIGLTIDPGLWIIVDATLIIRSHAVSLFDIIHVLFGFSLYIVSSYYLLAVLREREMATGTGVIREGFYGTVRHPVYGMILLQLCGLLFSLRSVLSMLVWGICVCIAVFIIRKEEASIIQGKFGEDYVQYQNDVKTRFFPKIATYYIIFLILLTILGMLI